jgi:hypothetical protein
VIDDVNVVVPERVRLNSRNYPCDQEGRQNRARWRDRQTVQVLVLRPDIVLACAGAFWPLICRSRGWVGKSDLGGSSNRLEGLGDSPRPGTAADESDLDGSLGNTGPSRCYAERLRTSPRRTGRVGCVPNGA